MGTFFQKIQIIFKLFIDDTSAWALARVVKGRTEREWLIAKIPLPETPLLLPE